LIFPQYTFFFDFSLLLCYSTQPKLTAPGSGKLHRNNEKAENRWLSLVFQTFSKKETLKRPVSSLEGSITKLLTPRVRGELREPLEPAGYVFVSYLI